MAAEKLFMAPKQYLKRIRKSGLIKKHSIPCALVRYSGNDGIVAKFKYRGRSKDVDTITRLFISIFRIPVWLINLFESLSLSSHRLAIVSSFISHPIESTHLPLIGQGEQQRLSESNEINLHSLHWWPFRCLIYSDCGKNFQPIEP